MILAAEVRRASKAQVAESIHGYAVANDVTMRDYQYKSHRWLQGKSWEGSTLVSPIWSPPMRSMPTIWGFGRFSTARKCSRRQRSSSSSVSPPSISTVSKFRRLLPGDMILTGTRGDIGFRRNPQILLKDGDLVRVEVNGLSAVETRVVAEPLP